MSRSLSEWSKSGLAVLGTAGWAKLGPEPIVLSLHPAAPACVSHLLLTAMEPVDGSPVPHVNATCPVLFRLAIQSSLCVHTSQTREHIINSLCSSVL